MNKYQEIASLYTSRKPSLFFTDSSSTESMRLLEDGRIATLDSEGTWQWAITNPLPKDRPSSFKLRIHTLGYGAVLGLIGISDFSLDGKREIQEIDRRAYGDSATYGWASSGVKFCGGQRVEKVLRDPPVFFISGDEPIFRFEPARRTLTLSIPRLGDRTFKLLIPKDVLSESSFRVLVNLSNAGGYVELAAPDEKDAHLSDGGEAQAEQDSPSKLAAAFAKDLSEDKLAAAIDTKTFNRKVVDSLSYLLRDIPFEDVDADGKISSGKVLKEFVKSINSGATNELVRIAAALCLDSLETLPEKLSVDEVKGFCARALRKRIEEQQTPSTRGGSGASWIFDISRATGPLVHPAFTYRMSSQVANGESAYQSFAVLNELHTLGAFSFVDAEQLVEMLENAVEAGFSMKPAQYLQRPLKYEGNIGDNTLIIPLSYCWASKEHADPELRTIKQVVRFLKYLIKTRHYKDARSGRTLGIGDQKPLLFLDYMSLPQKAGGRTFLDLQQFELGRKCVGILYAHAKTMTLLGTMTHENHEDGPLGRTEFFESGWPFFECQVAGLGKRPDMIYDLTVSLKWIDENFTESPYPRHQSNQSLFFLQEANRRKTTALPMNKRDFSTRVMDLNFMNSADRIFVDGKYAETSDEILGGLKELLREDTPLASAEDWKILLVETMPGYCKCLVNVNLSNNDKIQDVTLSSFESIAGTLEHLNLRNCPGFRGSLEPLMKCKKLKVLQMSGCLQIAGGLDWLEGLEELEEVDLECCFRLTGAILPLAGLEKLKVLNVCDTALGGSNGRSSGGSIDVSPDDAAVVAVTTQNMDAVLDQNVDVFVAAFQAAKKGEQCTIGRYGDAWKTPLWRAANSGQVLTIQMLLEGVQRKAGGKERMMVDVNAPGINSGDTALIQAARVGNVTAVRVLVKDYKADVDRTNKEGATPLIVAAQAGHATIVRALVKEFGADVDKAILSTGVTALMLGAKYGQKKVVKMLVEEGVDVDRASADTGATSLIDAAEEGHTDVVRVLLEKGKADVDKARTDNGATPLVLASQNGHLEVVRALVRDFGADVEARTDDGSTPLILAAENGRLTVVRVLLEDGKADVNKARTDNGATPLILASQNGHLEVVRDLLQYNADASKVLRSNGVTPLFAAAQEGHAEVVRVLLEDGKADVNKAMASTGATPLFGAAQAGHLEVVRVLLEGGKADVDKADSTGLTPVCRAAQAGRLDVVRLLLRHGADHTTTEKRSGRTPLQWAQANGRSEVAAVLKKHLTLRQLTSTDESSTPRKQKATSPHKASLLKAELPKAISSQKAARSRYLFHEMPPVL